MTYYNGVAGTWFPYAVLDDDANVSGEDEIPDMTSGNVAQDKTPGKDGLIVVGINDRDHKPSKNFISVKPGDAIAFHTYYDWIENYCPDSDNGAPQNWSSDELAIDSFTVA